MLALGIENVLPEICQSDWDTYFLTKQGLLQSVRFIFDTSIEDILLSRDCEITKQGKNVSVLVFKVYKGPAIQDEWQTLSLLCDFFFITQQMSQNNYICKVFDAWYLADVI